MSRTSWRPATGPRFPRRAGVLLMAAVTALTGALVAGPQLATAAVVPEIVVGASAPPKVRYAAQELQRYLLGLTGALAPIVADTAGGTTPAFVVGEPSNNQILSTMVTNGQLNGAPGSQGYALKRATVSGRDVLAVSGGDDEGALYGVYGLLTDYYGMNFTLTGDTYPAGQQPLALVTADETKKPRQAVRGVLPWTNFPQSATAYSMQDYKFIVDQLAKSRMNLLNLHNYNGQNDHDEPFANIDTNGVRSNVWMPTSSSGHGWGMPGWNVNDYRFGAGDLADDYAIGSELGLHNEGLGVPDVFGKGKALFQWLLKYAHSRGVRIALGLDLDLIPQLHHQAYNATGVTANRATALATDYPDLDYLLAYRSELMSGAQDVAWKAEFATLRSTMTSHGASTKFGVSGWGLSPTFMSDIPSDVIAAPIARYSASFDNGSGFGTREYWGCPWMEQDQGSSLYYYPYNMHLSNTIASYQNAAPNMTGFQTLTWRLGGAIDPKMMYLAKAPWYDLTKFPDSASVYGSYASAYYGATAANLVTPIINQNEAGARTYAESGPAPAPSGGDSSANRTKAQSQLTTIDSAISQTADPAQKARLGKLRARIDAVLQDNYVDQYLNTTSYAQLADHFRLLDQDFVAQVDDVSSLGNIVSHQNRYVQEWFAHREYALDSVNPVLAPVNVTARGTGTGAIVHWTSIEPGATGFAIYRDNVQVAQVPATTSQYADTVSAGAHSYQVVSLKGTATSQRSIADSVNTGTSDTTPPSVVVVSPPASVPMGSPLELEARLVDGTDVSQLAADLYYRPLGAATWSKLAMTRRTRGVFAATVPSSALGAGVQYYVSAYPAFATSQVGMFPADGPAHPASVVVENAGSTAPAAPSLSGSGHTLSITPAAGTQLVRIYRSRSATEIPGPATFLTGLGAGTTKYTDSGRDFGGLPLNGRYYYKVVALNAAGRPSASSQAVALDLGTGGRTFGTSDSERNGTTVNGQADSHVYGGSVAGWFGSGDQMVWNAPGAAEYVTLRYSNGFGTAKQVSLYVDGVFRQTLSLPSTGAWNRFESVGIGVHLSRSVMIKVTAADAAANASPYAINMASVSFGSQTEQTTEAESGTLTGATTATDRDASGGSVVSLPATVAGSSVSLTGTGTGTGLGIRYANGLNTSLRAGLFAGGNRIATITFPPTGGAASYRTQWLQLATTGSLELRVDASDVAANAAGSRIVVDDLTTTATDEGGDASVATRTGGQVVAQPAASGGATVGFFGSKVGDSLSWPLATAVKAITISAASIYTGHTLGVYNNGTRIATATFPNTGSWTVYQPLTITGSFAPGTVQLRADQSDVTTNAGWCCNIDHLTLNPPVFEAESGTFTGAMQTYTDGGASGGKAVGWFGAAAGDAITVGPMKGDGVLIRYANGLSHGVRATLDVNGTAVATVQFPPTSVGGADGWSVLKEVQVNVPVNGPVRIRFSPADVAANGTGYALNVDQLSTV